MAKKKTKKVTKKKKSVIKEVKGKVKIKEIKSSEKIKEIHDESELEEITELENEFEENKFLELLQTNSNSPVLEKIANVEDITSLEKELGSVQTPKSGERDNLDYSVKGVDYSPSNTREGVNYNESSDYTTIGDNSNETEEEKERRKRNPFFVEENQKDKYSSTSEYGQVN